MKYDDRNIFVGIPLTHIVGIERSRAHERLDGPQDLPGVGMAVPLSSNPVRLRNVVFDLGHVEAPPGETTIVTKIVTDPFFVEKIVFDGSFDGLSGIAFNLYVDRCPKSKELGDLTSQKLLVDDTFRVEIVNRSGILFKSSIRLLGKTTCS